MKGGDREHDADDVLKAYLDQSAAVQQALQQDQHKMRKEMRDMQARMDERMDRIEATMEGTRKHVRTMTTKSRRDIRGAALGGFVHAAAIFGIIATLILQTIKKQEDGHAGFASPERPSLSFALFWSRAPLAHGDKPAGDSVPHTISSLWRDNGCHSCHFDFVAAARGREARPRATH